VSVRLVVVAVYSGPVDVGCAGPVGAQRPGARVADVDRPQPGDVVRALVPEDRDNVSPGGRPVGGGCLGPSPWIPAAVGFRREAQDDRTTGFPDRGRVRAQVGVVPAGRDRGQAGIVWFDLDERLGAVVRQHAGESGIEGLQPGAVGQHDVWPAADRVREALDWLVGRCLARLEHAQAQPGRHGERVRTVPAGRARSDLRRAGRLRTRVQQEGTACQHDHRRGDSRRLEGSPPWPGLVAGYLLVPDRDQPSDRGDHIGGREQLDEQVRAARVEEGRGDVTEHGHGGRRSWRHDPRTGRRR